MDLWAMSPTRQPLRHSAHTLHFRPRVRFNWSHSKFDARSPLSQRGLRPPPHPPSPPNLQLGALVLLHLLNERLGTSHQPIVSLEPELPQRQVPGTAGSKSFEVHDAGRTGRRQAAASYEPNAAQTADDGRRRPTPHMTYFHHAAMRVEHGCARRESSPGHKPCRLV